MNWRPNTPPVQNKKMIKHKNFAIEIMEDLITREVKEKLPKFYEICNYEDAGAIIMHQSTFNYKEAELLGRAIKYAGLKGKEVRIIPKQIKK